MPINEYASVDSFYSLSRWLAKLNDNAQGTINPGYKAERITFDGGVTEVTQRSGGESLQRAEGSLAASDHIDFSQGDITGSSKATHLAIRGEGFFVLCPPQDINADGSYTGGTGDAEKLYLTRDGEFTTDANGLLVHVKTGYYLVSNDYNGTSWTANGIRAVYDNSLDANSWDTSQTPPATPPFPGGNPALTKAIPLTAFVGQTLPTGTTYAADGNTPLGITTNSLLKVAGNEDYLTEASIGAPNTVWDFGHIPAVAFHDPNVPLQPSTSADSTIAWYSLEKSNAPLEQVTPELAMAQSMYDNLTKVLSARKNNFQLLFSLFK